jgi:class 3 adenylate cyclase
VERRLAAILVADVAGYSRLMGMDEEGTLAQLKGHRQALVDPQIEEYRGHIVKTTGDGLLVEFASVVDAVRCAVAPHTTYLFKHALVQDAAYGTLLRQARRALHARIAETLGSRFAAIAESQPELLARHYTEA